MNQRSDSFIDVSTEERAIDALADPARWAAGAAELLRPLGFVLINAGDPGAPAGSHLLVALRDVPTLEHFDPETIAFYGQTREGKVEVVTLDRAVIGELGITGRDVLWGHLHVVDRLRVENRFLSFGCRLRIARLDPTLTALDFTSPGPIVRWGGHSQGTDWLAAAIGAFFGRLILAVDFRKGAESRLAATPPAVLYAAFLAHEDPRREQIARRLGLQRSGAGWIHAERERLRAEDRGAWSAGQELLADLDLERTASPR
ncbi:MAG: hypothetical protein FIA92_10315 [Chloroflexi bacterium]|nr:hypothetical protein [Chloroflexota bacterium]